MIWYDMIWYDSDNDNNDRDTRTDNDNKTIWHVICDMWWYDDMICYILCMVCMICGFENNRHIYTVYSIHYILYVYDMIWLSNPGYRFSILFPSVGHPLSSEHLQSTEWSQRSFLMKLRRTGRQWWGQDRHSWSAFVLLLQLPGSCHGRRGVLLLFLNVDRQVQNESNMTTCYIHLYHSHTHHHAHAQAHRFIHLISLRHWLLCRETIEGLNDVASIFFLPVSCESNFSKSLADASQSMTYSTFERAYWFFIDAMIWPCMGWDFRIRICTI